MYTLNLIEKMRKNETKIFTLYHISKEIKYVKIFKSPFHSLFLITFVFKNKKEYVFKTEIRAFKSIKKIIYSNKLEDILLFMINDIFVQNKKYQKDLLDIILFKISETIQRNKNIENAYTLSFAKKQFSITIKEKYFNSEHNKYNAYTNIYVITKEENSYKIIENIFFSIVEKERLKTHQHIIKTLTDIVNLINLFEIEFYNSYIDDTYYINNNKIKNDFSVGSFNTIIEHKKMIQNKEKRLRSYITT